MPIARKSDSDKTTSGRIHSQNHTTPSSPEPEHHSANLPASNDIYTEQGFDAAPKFHSSYIQDALSKQDSPATHRRSVVPTEHPRSHSAYSNRPINPHAFRNTSRPPRFTANVTDRVELQRLSNHRATDEIYPQANESTDSYPRSPSRSRSDHHRNVEARGRSEPPRRKRSLVRPERRPERRYLNQNTEAAKARSYARGARENIINRAGTETRENKPNKPPQPTAKKRCPSCWIVFSRVITFYAPSPILSCCGMKTPEKRQAWREKMALCTIIFFLCLVVGFLTFGLQQVLCGWRVAPRVRQGTIGSDYTVVHGRAYQIAGYSHSTNSLIPQGGDITAIAGSMDISFLFQSTNKGCNRMWGGSNGAVPATFFPCVVRNSTHYPDPTENAAGVGCHLGLNTNPLRGLPLLGDVYYEWKDIQRKDRNLVVYNGNVLDMNLLNSLRTAYQKPPIYEQLGSQNSPYRGTDVTFMLANYHRDEADCAVGILKVGSLDTTSMGCIISNIILYISLIVILGVVLSKFFLAVFFGWVLSWRLGSFRQETYEERRKRIEAIEKWSESPSNVAIPSYVRNGNSPAKSSNLLLPSTSRFSTPQHDFSTKRSYNNLSHEMRAKNRGWGSDSVSSLATPGSTSRRNSTGSSTILGNIHVPPTAPPAAFQPFNFPLAYTIMLVTAYSEDELGIRTTLDSLALTDYPVSHKMILVIADGLIVGAGNQLSTPDICVSMMKDFVISPEHVQPYSYIAIADGAKRHNMAKVYAGYYRFDESTVPMEKQTKVPMIVIAKCGTPEEADGPKPGNRGKRDSQIILMSFLQHVMFDDRMTEMEYELFNAIWSVTGISPDHFEIVLMVDADTKVYPDSVTRMVSCMVRDPQIMGLCGETKIANKRNSWVTMIQVFEYYISHHLNKAFESIFGGVTCLPGCFCMYRIKAPKGSNDFWVPVLASPDIIDHYSENVVDTLHKKNLLLLGEDRFLSTMMLRTFPKRKMIFVPQAVCKTVVPESFRVLLSQRRRWINSTVHNLLELVLIRDLCGTFCFSMQFVVFMELVGTVVLPAAICFTIYLVVISFITTPVPIIPLILLAIILGLPAVLILMTTRKLVYVGWMLIYLLALFIWNFVLPVYSFWHFDDFSWGQTRKVAGTGKQESHGDADGEFDAAKIVMKKWSDFEKQKRRKTQKALSNWSSNSGLIPSESLERIGYQTPSQLAHLSSLNLSASQSHSPSEEGSESSGSMLYKPLKPR
ncbi:hypothetical protein K493DRAFT_98927 [Basidiobolus meristosporus CBS 931.73]|uniref:chitin synthase n=1 Tax=Basidiobolus meristosporus CBS 931.73 TaxID=1314790 RepID=A0A1Y1X2Y2_9FUNG|nr:hypothetical protein K493DRAFT_98927 [Basidiobolus meristosporus CBS 931.73]|eukprot:ORX80052.1 hypothetical protein K493DRAFT_98927 [Basidiobolus meristosporus CBS 931.73]